MAKVRVLFVCTGNSARSQIAEAFLRDMAGDRYEALSAGVELQGLNPIAVEVMSEIGIDISSQLAKDISEFATKDVDFVVTVCDNLRQQCLVFPGTHKTLHCSLPDPAAVTGTREERLSVFRRIRDEIASRIEREFVQQTASAS